LRSTGVVVIACSRPAGVAASADRPGSLGRVDMNADRSRLLRPVGGLALVAAFVLVVAGFGVGSHGRDPHASFRCPPPLVSAWTRVLAFEKERVPPGTPDPDVEVACTTPAQGRLAVAASFGVIGVGLLAISWLDDSRRYAKRSTLIAPTTRQ
jgi:hypothetical protein